MTRELRLGQLLLGLRQTHVGKDVAAALRHRDVGLSFFNHGSYGLAAKHLARIEDALDAGALVTVTERSLRVRRLPIAGP
jgi:hypothetical protein